MKKFNYLQKIQDSLRTPKLYIYRHLYRRIQSARTKKKRGEQIRKETKKEQRQKTRRRKQKQTEGKVETSIFGKS